MWRYDSGKAKGGGRDWKHWNVTEWAAGCRALKALALNGCCHRADVISAPLLECQRWIHEWNRSVSDRRCSVGDLFEERVGENIFNYSKSTDTPKKDNSAFLFVWLFLKNYKEREHLRFGLFGWRGQVSGTLLMSYTWLPTCCDLRHQLNVASVTSNGEEVKEKQHFYRNALF